VCLAINTGSCTQVTAPNNNKPTIAIIGTGYVGLVTGACLAEFGNNVLCVDTNEQKITALQEGHIPFYEPGLEDLVTRNVKEKRLSFTTNLSMAIKSAGVIFIAVGTPMSDSGAADLSAVKAVVHAIAEHINSFKVIVTKSTVPIGTGAWIQECLLDHDIPNDQFAVVSNPEFLREGSAVDDCLNPDRIVVGTMSPKADLAMRSLYASLIDKNVAYMATNIITAESIKYASNAFLATKISFINELANVCDATGADVQILAHALGLDKRISKHFLNPGPGFGGSCFPKDTEALLYTSRQYGVNIHTVEAALKANEVQKKLPVKKLLALTDGNIAGKTVAVLGLAFKANTDDIRYSPAITTINKLLKHGAIIRAYDPQAMESMKVEFPEKLFPNITYCASLENAIEKADAVIIMTEWDEFRQINIAHIAQLLNKRVLVDARNILDPAVLREHGFIFDNIGRSCLCVTPPRSRKKAAL